MAKQHTNSIDSADRPALKIEITPAMIEAGVEALGQLARHDLEANPYSLELLVREVLGSSLASSSASNAADAA